VLTLTVKKWSKKYLFKVTVSIFNILMLRASRYRNE